MKRSSPSRLAALLLLTAAGWGCGSPADPGADAAAADAALIDAAPPSDAGEGGRDGGEEDGGPPPVACAEAVEARGWTHCGDDADRCELVFEDGTGCREACAALGMFCAESYDDADGTCDPLEGGETLDCGDTGHMSDHCVCTAEEPPPPPACGPTPPTHVYLIGDSTVASGSGWGDFLEERLTGVTVTNAAVGGTSSKSFYDGGRFDAVRAALAPGDYVLIQFGHNDAKSEAYRATDPGTAPDYEGTYRDYLERYISEIRAAGATPILITSVSRMVFGSDGALRRTHGEYPAAARQVALDHEVAFLDLEEHSFQVFDRLGEAETLRLYAEEGDLTHFPPDKAFRVTDLVTELLAASTSPLRCYLPE